MGGANVWRVVVVTLVASCGDSSSHPDAKQADSNANPTDGSATDAMTDAASAIAFAPASGPIGTLVTLTGADFSTLQAITINGTPSLVVSSTPTTAVALVMPGTTSGTVAVGTAAAPGTFTVTATGAPATQQGGKLVGSGAVGAALNAVSVAVSADGNTAVLGGYDDNSNAGAAWVFTRSGNTWSQQGAKLVGSGAVDPAYQGNAVAVSADGNTVVLAGYGDNSNAGAVWVFTRSGGTWTQQGVKLVGTGATGTAYQGSSVAVSADGNTAIIGGHGDNTNAGATWVFTRSGGTWTQQGTKLVGTGATGNAQQGTSLAVSADGNTAVIGGPNDNSAVGAAWVFTRSGGTWTQQGTKLVGTGATGAADQGHSVSVSADGNTAVIGGYADNSFAGAVWVFTRAGATWSQQGTKLVGTGATGAACQGYEVATSADGNTVLAGATCDNSNAGAAWVFTRASTTWSQHGSKLVGTGATGAASQGYAVALSADSTTAIVGGYRDNSSAGAAWVFTP